MNKHMDLISEMIDYCVEHQNFSYCELLNYADNNRADWAMVLANKKSRTVIRSFLESARFDCKKQGIKQPTLYESIKKTGM